MTATLGGDGEHMGTLPNPIEHDFMLAVAAGDVPGYSGVNKFGRNTNVGTGTVPEDVWTGGDIWLPPTQARIHDFASTSVDDAAAGTGAQSMRVWGLPDWDTEEVVEDIDLDGLTNVPTVNAYVMINRLRVTAFGSGNESAGLITATAQVDGTVTARAEIGKGQTQMAIFGFPSTHLFLGSDYYASINRSAASAASTDIELLVNDNPDSPAFGWRVGHHLGLATAGTSKLRNKFDPKSPFPGPAIIKMQVENVSANGMDISAGFNGVLRVK